MRSKWVLGIALLLAACGEVSEPVGEVSQGDDLPIGEVVSEAADGFYGAATTCKEIPDLPALNDPKIVISLDGLTLHLWDAQGDYDKVFPIGVGAIEDGESLTPTSTQFPSGRFYTRTDERRTVDGPTPSEARWGWNHSCRMWWTSETGDKVPVFAGLPFIRLAGHPTSAAYGIHGPIDNYTIPSGGTLRRGYVSHGCVRMSAEGIVEVFARLQGKQADVVVQQGVEREADGTAVQHDPWLLSECSTDSDCDFNGGFCHENEYGRKYCTQRCTKYCPDRAGHPTSFCVADPDGSGGICTLKATDSTNACRRYDGFAKHEGVARPDRSARADVCLPGSQGWIGDRCMTDSECDSGLCTPIDGGPEGVCTEPCSRYCPDKDGGYATTFCVEAPASVPEDGGMCLARCVIDDDCPLGTQCEEASRFGQPSVSFGVCMPQ